MASKFQKESSLVQEEVYSKDYYIELYETSLVELNLTADAVEHMEYSNAQLVKLWNVFWRKLPDSKAIRRQPFFKVCDLAAADI